MKVTLWSKGSSQWPPPTVKTNMQPKLNKQHHVTSKRRHQSAPCRICASLCEASVPYFLALWKDLKGVEDRGWWEIVPAGSRISGWSCRELLALVTASLQALCPKATPYCCLAVARQQKAACKHIRHSTQRRQMSSLSWGIIMKDMDYDLADA